MGAGEEPVGLKASREVSDRILFKLEKSHYQAEGIPVCRQQAPRLYVRNALGLPKFSTG